MHNLSFPTKVGRKKWADQRLVRTLMVGALMSGVYFGYVAPASAATAPTQPGTVNPTIDTWEKTGRTISEAGPDGSTNIFEEIKNSRTGELGKIFRENVPAEEVPEPEPAPNPLQPIPPSPIPPPRPPIIVTEPDVSDAG